MSMSEFERPEKNREKDFPLCSKQRLEVPGDFTEEDLVFAAELNALFSPEEENLPPYYVQTLLDVDDQRFEPIARGFEYKTSARVFRRLKLGRRLFGARTSPAGALSASIRDASLRRSALAMVGTFVLIMLLTVAFTGTSFASGVAILLRGTHGNGVYLTDKYPVSMVHPPPFNWQDAPEPATKQTSLLVAQQQMHFPIYWPQYSLPSYTLQHINFYVGLDQQWADGPMLEFEFDLPPSAVAPKGTGEVWVREFKPRADVLQLVKQGASIPIEMDENGQAMAIYVNGQWEPSRNPPVWVFGGRSELIYQIDGVVFWIVGDQRDGVGEKQLMRIAQGLMLCPFGPQFRMAGASVPVTQMHEDLPGPFSTDVIIVFSGDSGDEDGPYYYNVSSYQPPKNAH